MEGTVLGVPSFALSQAYAFTTKRSAALADGDRARARSHPQRPERGHSERRAGQHQLPRLRCRTRSKVSRSRCRASAIRSCCASSRAMTAAAIRITGSLSTRGGHLGARPGSDLAALNDNKISVTPLRLDLTDEPFMTRLADLFDLADYRRLSPRGGQRIGEYRLNRRQQTGHVDSSLRLRMVSATPAVPRYASGRLCSP